MKRPLLSAYLFFIITTGYSQSVLDIPITGISEKKSLHIFLEDLEKKAAVKFFFVEDWLASFYVDANMNDQPLREILQQILTGTDISFSLLMDYAVIFTKDPRQAIERQNLLRRASLSRKHIERRVIGDPRKRKPASKVLLKGTVINETNKAKMAGALVQVNDVHTTVTDESGRYAVELISGEHVISFKHVNFAEKVIDLKIYEHGIIDITLEETPTILEEVVISDQAIVTSRVSQSSLKMKDIKRLPTFLGEVDIIKQLQSQAGVTTVGEVASGFNVRGGGVDQNLVLYDGVPVFNTSHALGFFTAFNPEAIEQVSFYRGGIPAEYGGRVSSVLNITSREGAYDKWTGGGGIGIISSHLTLGGPIKRDTTSVLASIRSSYSNWMLNAIKSNYKDVQSSSVSFYDGSLKISHRITSRTKLTVSGYASHDEFSLANDTVYSWNNLTGSVRLDHTNNKKLFSSITLGFGKYDYQLSENEIENAFDLRYSVTYPSLQVDFNYTGSHELSFGLHNTVYDFDPGSLTPTSNLSDAKRIKIQDERSLESALYLSDKFRLNENIFIEAGLRYVVFNRFGYGKVYSYRQGEPIEERNIVDSTFYQKGEIVKTYYGMEPRASMRYTIDDNASVKLGYNRIYQFLHLITNTAAVTPVDIWQSSNTHFRPQRADQLSLGYYRNFKGGMYEAFIEGYYKYVEYVLDFKDGANLILNDKLETALLSGYAKSYGAEISVNKIKGRFTGNANYSYSRSLRKVDSAFDAEEINNGKQYPSNYDQPHIVNLNWRYGISRRHFFSGNFTYHTGRPMSLPISTYRVDGIPVSNFSGRNQYRLPDYHRLDVAFIIEGNHKRKKAWDGTWVVSFYNIYARRNAYSVFLMEDNKGFLRPYKLSVVGSVIPSLSYTFKF